MHSLFSKKTLGGVFGLLVIIAMILVPSTTHRVDAAGGYTIYLPSVMNSVDPLSPNSTQVTIISADATWKYFTSSTAAANGWISPSFNDSAWLSGAAPLGYGNGTEKTVISYGSNANNKWVTAYFRKTFNLNDPSQAGSLKLSLLQDDGAVVYLNGQRVYQNNMPSGTNSNSTLASTCVEDTITTADLNPALLVQGVNVLAVEVHQCNPTSSDLAFKAQLTATRGNGNGKPNPTAVPTQPPAQPTATQVVTQPPAQPTATKVVTQPPAEPTATKVVTQPPAQPTATKVPTQPPAQPTATKAPTQPPAQPTATKVPTQPPAPTATKVPAPTQPPATGTVYYVATNGSDSNPGTINSPWRTVSKGISALGPGVTVYVRGGTYNERASVSKSGTSSNRAVLAAYPGETPVLEGGWNGSGSGNDSNWVYISGSYVTFEGFEVRNTPGNGATIAGSYNILRNDNFHNMMNCGIIFSGGYHIMEYSQVSRASQDAMPGNENHSAIWCANTTSLLGTHDVTIRHSKIFNSWGEGLDVLKGDRFVIEDNILWDNWALNLYLDNATNTVVQRNLIYFTTDTTWWRGAPNRPGTGIAISDEPYSSGENHGHDRKIINNIVIGSSTNLRYFVGGAGSSSLNNDVIANNTFVEAQGGSGASGIVIEAPTGTTHKNSVIRDNIFLQSTGTIASIPSLTGITLSNNLWSRAPASQYKGAGDIVANPLLVAPNTTRPAGGASPDWYKLQASSPAIGAAASISQVTNDFFGTARSSAPSIGAHEYR